MLQCPFSTSKNYSLLTDNELAVFLQEGDREAYTEIYKRYNSLLYVFAYKRLGDREEVKDIIHELFLSLWMNRESLTITTGLAQYLYTCTRNRILNLISHKKISSRYIDSLQGFIEQGNDSSDHLVRHKQLQAFIEKEIAALPPRMREVFEMSRKSNLSRKEIAKELDISEQTVKSQIHIALKVLRVKLGAFLSLFIFMNL